MNGIEATRKILEIDTHSKVIFATADEEVKEEALKVGAFAVITKPFEFEELLTTINESSLENVVEV